jgi:hypothetical protein
LLSDQPNQAKPDDKTISRSQAMSEPVPGGRRRIDRVLADDFVAGLEQRELDEVRSMRRDAEQEEADLSYLRRMLQGRMDILRAELSRRGAEGATTVTAGSDAEIVAHLASVLADEGSRVDRGLGRFLTVEPSRVGVDEHRREVEQIVADVGISDVEAQTDADLQAALERLAEFEGRVSDLRRRVQQVMDACSGEITRRYRDGAARVDDLLPGGS